MTKLQLVALIENIPLNVKNGMRCIKKRFFFIISATAISGMPTPEICYSPGQMKRTIFPQERYGDSLSVGESDTQPSNCEGHSSIELSPPQRNFRRQCLGVTWCYDVPWGRYWGTNDTR